MHIFFKRQIFGGCQRHTRGCNAFHRRVVCQVDEQHRAVDSAGFAEAFDKEVGFLKGDTHGGEHHGERLIGAAHLCLPRNLRRQIGVGQTAGGEDGQLLPAHQRVQSVDRGNTGLDKLLRIVARCRVDGQAVDIPALRGQDRGTVVDGAAQTVKHAPQHILRYAQLHAASQKPHLAVVQIDTGRVFKQLHQRVGAVDLQHLAAAFFAVLQLDFAQLVIGNAFHAADQHQRSGDFLDGTIFLRHYSSSFCFSASISSASCRAIASYSAATCASGVYLNRPIRSRTGSFTRSSIET